MYHLPRLIGMARAKNFLFSGATMSAQEALDLGLVAKVVPDDQVEAAGLAEAARLAEGPAEVMGLAKTLMARSFETSLVDMFAFEGFGQVLAMSSPEFREGLSAALENRRADFAGAAAAIETPARATVAAANRIAPNTRTRSLTKETVMDPAMSAEIEAVRDMVNRFMETEVVPVMDGYEKRGEFPRELVRKAGEAGLYGAVFPESVGGSNMGYLAATVIQEEMARNDVRFCLVQQPAGLHLPELHLLRRHAGADQEVRAEPDRRQDHRHDVAHRVGRRLRCRRQHEDLRAARRRRLPHQRPEDVGVDRQRDRCRHAVREDRSQTRAPRA